MDGSPDRYTTPITRLDSRKPYVFEAAEAAIMHRVTYLDMHFVKIFFILSSRRV